jgi:hypothetical protein
MKHANSHQWIKIHDTIKDKFLTALCPAKPITCIQYAMYPAIIDMAAALNRQASEAKKARDSEELMEYQLRAARESFNDTQQRLFSMAENLMEERAAKDKVLQQLQEMAAKLDAECRLKDELQQQLSITTNNLNGALRMESEQHDAKVAAEQGLTEMAAEMDAERRARNDTVMQFDRIKDELDAKLKEKDEIKQELKETIAMLDAERRANDHLTQRCAEAIASMESERKAKDEETSKSDAMAAQLEFELKARLDAEEINDQSDSECRDKDESKHQPKETNTRSNVECNPNDDQKPEAAMTSMKEQDSAGSSVPSHTSPSKKRKMPHENTETNRISFHTKVQEFIKNRIKIHEGGFLATHTIYDHFTTENGMTESSTESPCIFQKILKNYILQTFSAHSEVGYCRSRNNGERAWGYTGLAWKQ